MSWQWLVLLLHAYMLTDGWLDQQAGDTTYSLSKQVIHEQQDTGDRAMLTLTALNDGLPVAGENGHKALLAAQAHVAVLHIVYCAGGTAAGHAARNLARAAGA
jgi:hypothetical protein